VSAELDSRLAAALGEQVRSLRPLSGGCVGEVYEARLAGGRRVVVKVDEGPAPRLDVEGSMLSDLAATETVPVPAVLHAEPSLLVMEHVESDGRIDGSVEVHAADLLAALHGVGAGRYGYPRETLIAALPQPNGWTESWPRFFAEQRLLHLGRLALDAGRLPSDLFRRIERVADAMEHWLPTANPPGLVHGDVWSGNVLARGGQVAAFIDPAISYSDPEIELAFVTLFSTFGDRFFARYRELRPISADFFELRRDLYNLYPLLVHVRLFGGGYVGQVERIVRRLAG
jgi:fructosamine-3-kinase